MSHAVETLLHLRLQNQLASNGFACPGALFLPLFLPQFLEQAVIFMLWKNTKIDFSQMKLRLLDFEFGDFSFAWLNIVFLLSEDNSTLDLISFFFF